MVDAFDAQICARRRCVGEMNDGMAKPRKFDGQVRNGGFCAADGTQRGRFDGVIDDSPMEEDDTHCQAAEVSPASMTRRVSAHSPYSSREDGCTQRASAASLPAINS